jgi:hypothetical protein
MLGRLNEYCPAGRTALPQWISEGRVNSPFIADWALAKPAERHRIPTAIAMVLTDSNFLFLFISTSPFFPELAPDAAHEAELIVRVRTQ